MRHQCNKSTNGTDWAHCCICGGRMHIEGCTARMNPEKDCCTARHRMLYEQGQKVGVGDSSLAMWDEFWEGLERQGKQNWWDKDRS